MNPKQFFYDFFSNTYICVMAEGNGQFEGMLVKKDTDINSVIEKYQTLNQQKNNVFFTPNGGKAVEGRNSLSNINNINAWWIDIDIDACKKANDDETKILRETKKSEIAGKIFASSLWPSLTVETRNGFQLYWFSDETATKEDWLNIGYAIYEFYKDVGADKSTVKIMQLMRVPNFYFHKNGEMGKIKIWPILSTMEKHNQNTMMHHFPPNQHIAITSAIAIPKTKSLAPRYVKDPTKTNDIFIKVVNAPIDHVIEKISKHWLVDGDELKLQKLDTEKSNVLVNGQISPNFVVRSKNHIYSNNASTGLKGPTIIQYIKWYGHSDAMIAKGLKELFI